MNQIDEYATPNQSNDRAADGSGGGTVGTTFLTEIYHKPRLRRQISKRDKLIQSRDSVKKIIAPAGAPTVTAAPGAKQ